MVNVQRQMTPPFLKIGDKVGIVSPSGKITSEELSGASSLLASWGLQPIVAPHAADEYGCFAGTPSFRIADLQRFLDDREIKAVLCSRGGYGLMQIIEELDFAQFEIYPKWVIGYSDVTVLHNVLSAYGIASIHAPMARNLVQLSAGDELLRTYRQLLFGKMPGYCVDGHPLNRKGFASGKIVGGNLSVFFAFRGTFLDLDYTNKILFIEDIGEKPHQVDRMVRNLKLGGVLENLSGLIVGQFSSFQEDESMCQTVYEMIADAVSEYGYPVCFNFSAGHVQDNLPLVFNYDCRFRVSESSVTLDF